MFPGHVSLRASLAEVLSVAEKIVLIQNLGRLSLKIPVLRQKTFPRW